MAGSVMEKQLAGRVYSSLQAVSCPMVEDLYLQEVDSMLQLLCAPSQHRTHILAWICSRVNPNFGQPEATSVRTKDPDVLCKEMAMLGQELMLCKADDLDLIRGDASPNRQLRFLEQLLTLIPGCKESAGHRADGEVILNELFAAENLPHLLQMLKPRVDPLPAHIKALQKGTQSSSKPSRKEPADVATILQLTQTALEQLQSECDFLNNEAQTPDVFSPGSLRVAACDLQQLMTTFSRVYESDLRAYCSRDPPGFSNETDVFQRVHRLLLALITELEMLKEVSEASVSMNEDVNKLQTRPSSRSQGEKRTFQDQLEDLKRRTKDFLFLMTPTPSTAQTSDKSLCK